MRWLNQALKEKNLGKRGENEAKRFLLKKGYQLVAQNFRTKFGEIDLIFLEGGSLVFVEVKTRTADDQGRPEEAVNRRKLEHITKVAEFFMQTNPKWPKFGRIDVVAVEFLTELPRITHFENVSV